jgi:hypothetical protein
MSTIIPQFLRRKDAGAYLKARFGFSSDRALAKLATLSCIDDEDVFLRRTEEILKPYGGRIEDFRLADNDNFELSFEVPEEHINTIRLLLRRILPKHRRVVRR